MVRTLLLIVALSLVLPPAALAYEDQTPAGGEASFHLGVFAPRGESELWRENSRLLTQDVSDFDDLIGGASFASHLNRYLDFVIDTEYYESWVETKYRNFFFVNGDPIEQSERFRMIPIDLSIRFLPTTRTTGRGTQGRRVLRPVVPYLGFGGGALLWDYREEGIFLDLSDPNDPVPFNANSHARGITGSYHVLAGVEVQFTPELALQLEGRYRWVKDDLGSDFQGFDRFDLSGGSLEAGMSFRF